MSAWWLVLIIPTVLVVIMLVLAAVGAVDIFDHIKHLFGRKT